MLQENYKDRANFCYCKCRLQEEGDIWQSVAIVMSGFTQHACIPRNVWEKDSNTMANCQLTCIKSSIFVTSISTHVH